MMPFGSTIIEIEWRLLQRMLITMAIQKTRRSARRKLVRNLGIVFRLIFCFPLGLYAMWTRAAWPKWAKAAVSAAVAAVLVVILTPSTNPPERQIGGIVPVEGDASYVILGPDAPEDQEEIEIYTPRRTAIIVEATPTPVPVIVYCNPGGQYYHSENCEHIQQGQTPQATLEQALRAGYRQCPDCDAPSELGT